MRVVRKLWHDEAGVSTVEYALLLAIVAVGSAGAWTALRSAISSVLGDVASTVSENGH